MASTSIMNDVKKVLNLASDFTAFDIDVMMHINSVLSVLNQLGIGPADGFVIEDTTATWEDFLGTDKRLNNVKTYVYLKVRMYFDPPQTAHHTTAMQNQIAELESRLNILREGDSWTPQVSPTPTVTDWCPIF